MSDEHWLGFARWDVDEALQTDPVSLETAGLYGPLRGVTEIEFGRLQRALSCEVVECQPGLFWVFDPHGRDARKIGPDGLIDGDLPGQFVHLDDPRATRCYCEDFLQDGGARKDTVCGEEAGRPCKHILAACLHHPVHAKQLEPHVQALVRKNAIAAAMKKPAKD